VIDKDFRDFEQLHEVTRKCPQICCMSATIQPTHSAELAAMLGRKCFTKGITMTPHRAALSLQLKVSLDPKLAILSELQLQEKETKAIIFCLFKATVSEYASILKQKLDRDVYECVSASLADVELFRNSKAGIMVCTSVLAAGVSFEKVSRVFFLECAHSPEEFLQGAGRGARVEGEVCIATLCTSKAKLEKLQLSNMTSTSNMASFCLDCITRRLDFATTLYGLFDHEAGCSSQRLEAASQSYLELPSRNKREFQVCSPIMCYVSVGQISGSKSVANAKGAVVVLCYVIQ